LKIILKQLLRRQNKMFNIIKSDLYRILRGKAFYILLLIIVITMVTSAVAMSAGHVGLSTSTNVNVEDTEFLLELQNAKSLKEVREIMKKDGAFALDQDVIGANANLYYAFIVIVVIILCTDFSNKCIKNTLTSAISKKKYYFSKIILIFGICAFLIAFNNYGFYLLNLLINGKAFSSSLLDITKYTLLQIPMIYGMISLLLCFAFLFKKTSSFNTVAIPFIMVIQIIVMAGANLLHIDAKWFYDYEFQFALTNLVNHPTSAYILKCTALGIFYIILFNAIGYYTFKNTEIK